jgi:hypothetical protein
MKNLFFGLIITLTLVSCSDNDAKLDAQAKKATSDTLNYTTIQWLDTLINFGTVKQGEKVTVKFRCLNTGKKPLMLTYVRPGCGCTVAEYTKEAILPGKEGYVMANFDSKKFCDVVNKTIMAASNTTNDKDRNLKFTGTITNCESTDKVVMPKLQPDK